MCVRRHRPLQLGLREKQHCKARASARGCKPVNISFNAAISAGEKAQVGSAELLLCCLPQELRLWFHLAPDSTALNTPPEGLRPSGDT